MLTHFASLDLVAVGGGLGQSSCSPVERGECGTVVLFVSSRARSAVRLSHGSFSSVVVWHLTEELAIDFAQWARHTGEKLEVVVVAIVYLDEYSMVE